MPFSSVKSCGFRSSPGTCFSLFQHHVPFATHRAEIDQNVTKSGINRSLVASLGNAHLVYQTVRVADSLSAQLFASNFLMAWTKHRCVTKPLQLFIPIRERFGPACPNLLVLCSFKASNTFQHP